MKQFKYLGFNDMGKTTTNKKEQCNLCGVSCCEKCKSKNIEVSYMTNFSTYCKECKHFF